MKKLEQHTDGIAGTDLGIIGESQYATSGADIYRRPASHAGTYGGWRWECAKSHPAQFPHLPYMAELAAAVAEAAQ